MSTQSNLDPCLTPGLTPLSQALQYQLEHISPITQTETVSLADALGRVVAVDLLAPLAVPPQDNSAMDGYALDAADLEHSNKLALIGTALAGQPFAGEVCPGQTVRIMTGAPLPKGANAVVMQENTERTGDKVTFKGSATAGQCVRYAGEDIAKGDVVVAKGARIRPPTLSLLASLGISEVTVFRNPIVGVLATGDELVEPGAKLADGQIYESNRIGIKALLSATNAMVKDYGIVPDDLSATKALFTQASQECDWLISSGGVSVGDADFVKDVLDELGKVNFWKVAIKPGKPYAFGRIGQCWFSGLPGNPVSSFVTFEQLVAPALQKLSGESNSPAPKLSAKLTSPIKRKAGREEFLRARLENNVAGELTVTPLPKQGSAMMSGHCAANCYLIVPAQAASIDAGATVQVQPFKTTF